MGHQLPRRGQIGMSAIPSKAATTLVDQRGGFGPLSAARTRSKNSPPIRRLSIVNYVTDLPIEA